MKEHSGKKLILGVDPGFDRTGFAILDPSFSPPRLVEAGLITTSRRENLGERLHCLQNDLRAVLKGRTIVSAAVEKIFFSVNVKSAIEVAQARGVVLALLAELNIPVTEYTPSQIKKAVTGSGTAGKKEIQEMVRRLLKLSIGIKQDDTADAVAMALCHGNPNGAFKILSRVSG